MTPEEKVALLKEAGVWDVIGFPGCIDKLIALVAAHERDVLLKQLQQQHDDGLIDAWDVLELLKVEK